VNFPQFSDVLVWSVQTVSLGVRTDQQSERYSLGVRTGVEPKRPDRWVSGWDGTNVRTADRDCENFCLESNAESSGMLLNSEIPI
jgi:hypothetical protein